MAAAAATTPKVCQPDSETRSSESLQVSISVDGDSLTPEKLVILGSGNATIDLTPEAWQRVMKGRDVVDEVVAGEKVVVSCIQSIGLRLI